MILVVLVLRSSNSGSSGSTSSTTISSITTWGPYHGGGGPLTRNTKPYINMYKPQNTSCHIVKAALIQPCHLTVVMGR